MDFVSFLSLQAMETLLVNSAEAYYGDHEDKTPLHIAAGMGHTRCVEILAEESRGSVNSTDEHGRSPLHYATKNGHV